MRVPIERALSYSEALSLFDATLRECGLRSELQLAGHSIVTAKCTLYGEGGAPVDFGYGKGAGESARTGACFEALEHYLSQPVHIDPREVVYAKASQFLAETSLQITRALETLSTDPDSCLPFRRYKNLFRAGEALYPLALSAPKYLDAIVDGEAPIASDVFAYSALSRYATNSGIAIGSSDEEAVIHGLLEAVERHTFSNFLANTFLNPTPHPIQIVDPSSLSAKLVALLRSASAELDSEILLISLPNAFAVPVFMASMPDSAFPIDPSGFGASLSSEYAVSRCITELVQCFHVTTRFHPDSVQSRDEKVINGLWRFRIHQKCAALKIAQHVRKYGSLRVNYSSLATEPPAASLREYLELIVTAVASAGFVPFTTQIAAPGNLVSVMHTFLDGQDHFFCVTEGALAFPNPRLVEDLLGERARGLTPRSS